MLARQGTAECVFFFSDYLGLQLSDAVLEHIGWVGEVADDVASGQRVSSGRLLFTVIGIEGGNVFTGFLEPRRGFLLDCRHPETRVFWECSVRSRLFAGIAPWLHGSLLTLVILVGWLELSPCMMRLCRIFYSTFLLYNIWEMWRFSFMTLLLISVTTTSNSLDWVWPAEGQLRSSWHGSRRYEGRRSLSLRCLKYWSRVLSLDLVSHWAVLVSR